MKVHPIAVSLPRASALICPTWQETYFAPHQNFSLNAAPKSNLQLPLSCPEKRGVGHRHERWGRLRWTRQRRAREVFAGRVFRERAHRADGRRLNASVETSSGSMRAGRGVWREEAADGKTVWSWHPLLVSSRWRWSGPTGLRSIANPSATEARGIRLRGERGISRKTTAQGRPGVPAHLRSAVCILCARLRVSWAPGFPCALCFREGIVDRITSGAPRAARSQCRIQPPAASIENNDTRIGAPA